LAQPPGLWLPSTHWMPAKVPFDPSNQVATQIYPRPDAETNDYAFHRNHYYDGVTQFVQRIPIIARGGVAPYNYVLMQAPVNSNARIGAVGWDITWTTPAQALAAGYGDLLIAATGSYTNAPFWVRVYGQDCAYIDFLFTASTTSSYDPVAKRGFIFLDPVNGVDPSSYSIVPTISSPMKTLNWAFGATGGTVTYPNAI